MRSLAVTRCGHECIMHSLLIVHDLHSRNRCRTSHEHQQPSSNQSPRRQTASHPRDRCASQTGSESVENIAMCRRDTPAQYNCTLRQCHSQVFVAEFARIPQITERRDVVSWRPGTRHKGGDLRSKPRPGRETRPQRGETRLQRAGSGGPAAARQVRRPGRSASRKIAATIGSSS